MKIFLILLSMAFLFGCNRSSEEQIVGALQQIGTKIAEQHQMQLVWTSIEKPDCIRRLGLGFQVEGPLPIEELTRLMAGCVEELVQAVESNQKIKPYLSEGHFLVSDADIAFYVVDKMGHEIITATVRDDRLFFQPLVNTCKSCSSE